MRCFQLILLYVWISGCYSECHSQCKCKGKGVNSKMDCSGNSLIYFPEISEIPISVGKIFLKNNNIERLTQGETVIGQRPNVWSIDISENKIIHVGENVFQYMFPNLTFLDLSNNRLQRIKAKTFFNLKLLRGLYLGSNEIRFISKKAFDTLKDLTNLNLNNNRLKVLDFHWFRKLKSLIHLHLEHNRIEKVKSWMYSWPSSLENIFLNNNRIPVIPPLPKDAKMFNLEANPTFCGCIPHTISLNDTSYKTLCSIRMRCNSITLKGDCKNKQITEEMYRFWKDTAAKPICQAPVITELAVIKNHKGMHYLNCVATGVPAPNIKLFSSDRGQKEQVHGVAKTNFTSVTMNQLHSVTYHCNASNLVDETTRKFDVDLKELDVNYDFNSTSPTLNLTSELPFLLTSKCKNTLYVLIGDNTKDIRYIL